MWNPKDRDDEIEVNGVKFKKRNQFPTATTMRPSIPPPDPNPLMPKEVARQKCREFIEALEGNNKNRLREPGED